MTQNPYADPTVDPELGFAPEPERTSLLAILSLVAAIICIIPGTGLLAIIFGIAAVLGIRASRGRVGGTGMAVAGILLGSVVTVLWVVVTVSVLSGVKQAVAFLGERMVVPAQQAMTGMDTGDAAKIREIFFPPYRPLVTDEVVSKFREAYQAEVGSFKNFPKTVSELVVGYQAIGQQMKQFQGRSDCFPVPANFDKGTALIVFTLDKNAQHGQTPEGVKWDPTKDFPIPFCNISILTAKGTTINMLPPAASLAPALPPPPAAPDAPPSSPPATPPPSGGGG